MATEAAYHRLGERARGLLEYFGRHHRFQFIKSLHSPPGGALLCNELEEGDDAGVRRKLIIKHGLITFRDYDIADEIETLTRLRGSEHVGQLVTMPDVQHDAQDEQNTALETPYFVLEYVPGGDLRYWVGRQLGEEALWSIFLCRELLILLFNFAPSISRPPPPLGRLTLPGD